MSLALPHRRTTPPILTLAAAAVAAAVLAPLAFLVLQANSTGWHPVFHLLFRHLTLVLIGNTVELAALVVAASAVLGTGAAWLVERTNLPGRRVWAVLVVVPVAIPDFVVGYSWNSIFPAVHGLAGATLVMSLAVYPLVYLPVAAALRRADPGEEEVARSLGLGPVATFARVTLRQVRPAITGGCLVVCLALLAEYGAFEIVGFQTFTTTIFGELNDSFDLQAASGLALVLVLIGLAVLAGEGAISTRGRISRAGGQAARNPARRQLTPGQMAAATVAMGLVVAAALGMPVGVLVYWMASSHATTEPAVSSLWSALGHTATYSAVAALAATAAALPVAFLSVRFRSPVSMLLERSTFVIQALPGLLVALALVFLAGHYLPGLYGTSWLLELAYAVLFFPLALICVRASVAQAPRRLEEVSRSLGRTGPATFVRVTLPLVAPGLAAGWCLVFLLGVTELTATLLLVPYGVATLATQFWAFQTNTSYGAAAPYAVVMVVLAAVPTYVLTRWFARRPGELPG